MSRQVSVLIRAALDSAFKSTFHTADQKLREVNGALKTMNRTATEMRGLQRTRNEISAFTAKLEGQKVALAEVQAQLQQQRLSYAALDQKIEYSRETLKRAAAAHAHNREELLRERAAIKASGQATREQAERLRGLEVQLISSADVLKKAKRELKEVTEEQRKYAKAAAASGESLGQLQKKEKEHLSLVAATERQIKRATEASERYASSLRKQSHNVDDLTEAENRHNRTIERQEQLLKRREEFKNLRDRSQDLRSQAMSHLYFTLGSGYLFTAPLQQALEFEKSMVRVKAMSGANSEEYKRLRDEARRLGAETIFTAREVAEAYNELATAGYRTNDMIAIMPSMLALSESSMTTLARTAEITSEVLQGFRIDVSEMARVGNALTAAYSSSASSLESLGEMLKYSAAPAVDVGSSLEQTLAASSVLHNTGIKGSMAGTSMRAIFLRLAKPPKVLQDILDDMKISSKDENGNVRDWTDIFSDINRKLKSSGTARRAAVSKALGGEEHAPAASNLLAAVDSGALKLMEKTFRITGPFNLISKRLLSMPDAELEGLARKLNIKINRAMSGGGLALAISESLKGLKGTELEQMMQGIFSGLNLSPALSDMKAGEFVGRGRNVDAALERLQISRNKPLGGEKMSDELTTEIKARLQTLPMDEQLKYIEILFSRTRSGVAELFAEFQKSGENASQLLKALDESLTMDKAKKGLSESTVNDLKKLESAWDDIKISLGNSMIPILKDFVLWLQPIVDGLGKWIKENQAMARNIMIGVGAFFAFSAAMAAVKFALSGFIDLWRVGKWSAGLFGKEGGPAGKSKNFALKAFSLLKNSGPLIRSSLGVILNAARAAGAALLAMGPAGWAVAAAIAAAAAAGIYLWRNWDTIGPKFRKTWAVLGTWFQEFWKSFADAHRAVWNLIVGNLGWDPLPLMKEQWEGLLSFIREMASKVKTSLSEVFEGKGFLSGAIDAGNDAFSRLFSMPQGIQNDFAVTHAAEKVVRTTGSSQRNVITVNANIHVEGGPEAPAQVAGRIKGEIWSAFQNAPSFSFLDPVVVS